MKLPCLLQIVFFLHFCASGLFAQQPTVTTEVATNVTDVSVTLNGTANPNGGTFHPSFDFGTTSSYGRSLSPTSSTISGSSSTSITLNVQALLPNTTYHYRLRGFNSGGGNIVGQDMTFTTGAPSTPPAFSGSLNASSIASAEARVSAIVLPGGSTTTVTFEYGLTTAYGLAAPFPSPLPVGTTGGPTLVLDKLTPATTYHYRCVATNLHGATYSEDNTFTTLPAPIVTTAAVTGLSDIAVTLNGSANAQGNSCSILFEVGTTTSYGTLSTTTPSVISGSNTVAVSGFRNGLLPSTTYHYRLRVSDGGHSYYYGEDMVFTTRAPMSPPTVGPINTSAVQATSVAAAVYGVSAGGAPAIVSIEYGPTDAYGSTLTYASTIATGSTEGYVSLVLTGLTPASLYHYRAKVTNALGTAYSVDGTFTTLALPEVVTTAPTSITDLSVVLNGTANGNNRTTNLYFDIGTSDQYGSTIIPTHSFVAGMFVTPVSVTYSRLLPNTTYHYRLRGLDNYGMNYVGEDTTFTTGAPSTPPTIIFVMVPSTATSATFYAPVSSGSSAASVSIEYGLTANYGSMASLSSVPINTTENLSTKVSGLSPNTLYHYRCTATNSEGTIQTADATFTTLPSPVLVTLPATSVTHLGATLTGSVNPSGGNLSVYFQYGTNTAYDKAVFPSPFSVYGTTTGTLSTNIAGLLPSTDYHYRIVCVDGGGSSYYGADATFTTLSVFENWRQQFFGAASNSARAADAASFSGDGVPNLLKYAFSLDPTVPGTSLLPQIVLKNYGGASSLSYTFPRDPTKIDLSYEVQSAENISGPWTTIASSVAGNPTTGSGLVAETPLIGGAILVEVRDTETISSSSRRFMRLQISH